MVDPGSVPSILSDAAWLVREGRIVVFGSAALAFWLRDPPRSRDVDLWVEPAVRGDAVTALMGELSWYHARHDAYVEVWGPETFAAPADWPSRARHLRLEELPALEIVVPHPHDVLMSKLERHDDQDLDHIRRIVEDCPLDEGALEALAAKTPYRQGAIIDGTRRERFEAGLERAKRLVRSADAARGGP